MNCLIIIQLSLGNSPTFFFFNRRFRNGFNKKFNAKDAINGVDIGGEDADSNQQNIFDQIDIICFLLSCFGYDVDQLF